MVSIFAIANISNSEKPRHAVPGGLKGSRRVLVGAAVGTAACDGGRRLLRAYKRADEFVLHLRGDGIHVDAGRSEKFPRVAMLYTRVGSMSIASKPAAASFCLIFGV